MDEGLQLGEEQAQLANSAPLPSMMLHLAGRMKNRDESNIKEAYQELKNSIPRHTHKGPCPEQSDVRTEGTIVRQNGQTRKAEAHSELAARFRQTSLKSLGT